MLQAQISKIKQLFRSRKIAYQQTFNNGVASKAVLVDLAKFCRANDTTFNKDPRLSAVLQGRHEVWLRVQQYLNLTPEELFDIHHIRNQGE